MGKLHVSAYSGHLQVFDNFLAKRVLYNMPKPCGDVEISSSFFLRAFVNPSTPNDHYSGRTASLTSKRCILYIYSTNTGTENFKHGIYSPFFSLQNAVCFIILTYLVPVLFTFYTQSVLNVAFYIFIQQI